MSANCRPTIDRVREFWADRPHDWLTLREVRRGLRISAGEARSTCRALVRKGFLISATWPDEDVPRYHVRIP